MYSVYLYVFNKSVLNVIYSYGSSLQLLLSFRPYLEITANVFSLHAGLLTTIA